MWLWRPSHIPNAQQLAQTLPDPARTAEEERAAKACAGTSLGIVASTKDRELYLCRDGRPDFITDCAFGRGGFGKRELGDQKTPLGKRGLLDPFSHKRFGTFMSVTYPTPKEEALGYTGSEIGVHGPLREYRDLGRANVIANWTDGCIAVQSDPIMRRIANWVIQWRARWIDIR